MTNSNNFAENTIVAFHIGRGGRFNNPGFLTFIGEEKIGKYTEDLFLTYENAYEIGKTIYGRENLKRLLESALEDNADAYNRLEKIGLPLGEKCYADACGNLVGLTEAEEESGVGCINIDNDYNTTYTCRLSDCDEKELHLIVDYAGYVDSSIVDYAKEQLGIVDEAETE